MDDLKLYFFEFEENRSREAALEPLCGEKRLTAFRATDRCLFAASDFDVLLDVGKRFPQETFRVMLLEAKHKRADAVLSASQALAYLRNLAGRGVAFSWHQSRLAEVVGLEKDSVRDALLEVLNILARSSEGKDRLLGLLHAFDVGSPLEDEQASPRGPYVPERQGGNIRINGRRPTPEEKEKYKLNRKLA